MIDGEKDLEKSNDVWLELSDEERCNWMMFVRPAQNHLEQNLVAYQYGSDIFYTTIKNIQPKEELKVSTNTSETLMEFVIFILVVMVFPSAGMVCSFLCWVCQSEDSWCNRRREKRSLSAFAEYNIHQCRVLLCCFNKWLFSVLREQEKNWPCYECNRRFVSSEQLQQHLNMHDEKLNSITK